METLSKLNIQIKIIKEKRRKIFDDVLDGRTQKWLSEKTGIDEVRLSKCITGILEFEQTELDKINGALNSDLTL